MNGNDPDLQRPEEENIKEITEKTRVALQKIVSRKVAAAMPVRAADKLAPAQYIRYMPSQQGGAFNSGAKQRVIHRVKMQKDPMEPPRFKISKKILRGPPSPCPAPVMHSPTQKTVQEQQEWEIPPCISNWRNSKGYTILLDKRVEEGCSLHVSMETLPNWLKCYTLLSGRPVKVWNWEPNWRKRWLKEKRRNTNRNVEKMAQKARERRMGMKPHMEQEDGEARERDEIRHDRQKERQHDQNLSRAAPEKKSKRQKKENRDISEVTALAGPSPQTSKEVRDDRRLFDQSKGMDSGFAGRKDEFTMFMIRPGEVAKMCLRVSTGPVKMWTKTCTVMTLEAGQRPTDSFLRRHFLVQTIDREAKKDQFTLRKILLVWTSFWQKQNSTLVLKDPPKAVALRNRSMKARSRGRSR